MTQLHAHQVHLAGTWPPEAEIDHIALDFDQRHRRRLLLITAHGRSVLLDLPRAQRLHHNDALVLPDGLVRIIAADEPVMDIHGAPPDLMRIAWHLGNRHLPLQLGSSVLRIRADHVIATMIEGLGGHVHTLHGPFEPEGGAYAPPSHTHQHAEHDHAHHHG